MNETAWHALDPQQAAARLETNTDAGLTGSQAAARLDEFGPNVITARRRKSHLVVFLSQFTNPLVVVLIGASVVTLLLRDYVDTGVIMAVVIINAVIGFIQEERAEKAVESLTKMLRVETTVLRDSETKRLSAEDIVPGDIVLLQGGDKVPADIRILSERNLHIDESILTGESAPVAKSANSVKPSDPVSDRTCMAYSGTLVTGGSLRGIVVATGDDTELGRISGLIAEAPEIATPLTRKLAAFGKRLSAAILGLAAVTFALGVAFGRNPRDTFSAAVAIAVAMIPEGLPAIVTIVLAVGVRRMAERHAIIRTLPAVETLGSVTVICSDKTGTLTANQMTVRQVHAGAEDYELGGIGYDPQTGGVVPVDADGDATTSEAFVECLRCGLLCNESRLVRRDNDWIPEGDPTEVALLTSAMKAGLDPDAEKLQRERIDVLPFESSNMYMATLNRSPDGSNVIYAKGSLERILSMCSDQMAHSNAVALDSKHIQCRADGLAQQGFRILAFARKVVSPETEFIDNSMLQGMSFLGIQAMVDPPRSEAIDAVRECKDAGIDVKMITGDHVSTARAVARDMGIGGTDLVSVTGSELAEMSGEEFDEIARSAAVFARVAPEQKYRLVESLQAAGEVAAMTGDGVNDAPALKKADIGVAMGKAGSDVAKDASDMVLTDDNFASIVAAVEEGRTVLSNLLKTLAYVLPTNLGEGLIILVALLGGYVLPVTPVQILWINTVTTVTLALPLAFEPREPGIMKAPPRDPDAPIMTAGLIVRIIDVGIYMVAAGFTVFLLERSMGGVIAEARTAAVTTIVGIETFYLFQARSEQTSLRKLGFFSNPYIWIGVLAVTLLQLAFVHLPAMNFFFGSTPLTGNTWFLVVLLSLPVTLVVGAERAIKRWSGGFRAGAGSNASNGEAEAS
jgi:cation-transporting ATPase F